MNNNLLRQSIKTALNKLDSNDYDNIECWQIAQAYNKARLDWCRREAKKGEDTNHDVDDLSPILLATELKGTNKNDYFESVVIPKNYLAFKRVSITAKKDGCTMDEFKVYSGEEANVNDYLSDDNKRPSFEWAETFKTHIDNKIHIYTAGDFKVETATLVYYRTPNPISFEGCVDENDNPTSDVPCEFKDDVVSMLIDETAALLAGAVDNFNQVTRNVQNAVRNQ